MMGRISQVVIEQVAEITSNLEQELYNLIIQLTPNTNQKNFSWWLQRVVSFPYGQLFVAREGERSICGTLTLMRYPTLEGEYKTWIEDVIVDQSARGKGIGEKLVQRAVDVSRQNGASQINLTSSPSRIAANSLYRKLGFKLHDTNYYRYTIR